MLTNLHKTFCMQKPLYNKRFIIFLPLMFSIGTKAQASG